MDTKETIIEADMNNAPSFFRCFQNIGLYNSWILRQDKNKKEMYLGVIS